MNPTRYPESPVLLVDDEEAWLHSFTLSLRGAGITNIRTCSDSREVQAILAANPIVAVVLDLTMPHISGQELLPQILGEHPGVPVIIVTGLNDIDNAVECMKTGAFDYFVKSAETDRLVGGIRRAVEFHQLKREHKRLRDRLLTDDLEHPEAFVDIVSNSDRISAVFRYLEAIAISPEPVLIHGETGVGKELFARAVHTVSGCQGEFVPVNAAGLDDHHFSDTLFGHKKGAFTGADSIRKGLIETAQGGTLFLDEIGDLAVSSQVKLLRLIQEHEYYPIGSDVAKKAEVRIVVVTNRDLNEMTARGMFRKDLYYRLATHRVEIPPLRSRKEDILPLLDHFLVQAAEQIRKPTPSYPRELLILLANYSFPGNVRELRSMVIEAVTRHTGGILSMDAFKQHIRAYSMLPTDIEASEIEPSITFGDTIPTLKEVSRLLIEEAMQRAEGNQAIAAQMLGITRQALNKRLQQS